MIDIDNKKIWESIRNGLWHWPQEEWLIKCIDNALWEQGFEFKDGKIVSIEPESKIEAGKWYVCTLEDPKCYGFTKGKIYQAVHHKVIGTTIYNDNGSCVSINGFKNFFRPATPGEIPQEPKQESSDGDLSEFENRLGEILHPTWDIMQGHEDCQWEIDGVKKYAKELLSIARKQLQPEIDAEIEKAYKNQDDVVYQRGYIAGMEAHRDDLTKEILSRIDVDEMVENLSSFRFGAEATIKDIYKNAIMDAIKTIKGE